jgi:diguanylate cyclase (GGDEF)-like protein
MVRLTEDRALMLTWPVQDPVGRVLGFFSCAINASGLQAYSQAARRSILIVTTLCFGLAILTVVGSHMMITAPVVRLLMRMNRLLRAGHGTVDELQEGLHGEALVLAGQVGMAISKLSQSSRADPGTGLPNRRNFEEVLNAFYSQASRYHRPLSILVLDIDHFKNINDKLGHLEGDEVLRGVAKAMIGALRGADRPARMGGDEFAAILPETSAEHAAGVAERIRRAVMEIEVPGALGQPVTVSIGVADLDSGPTDCPQDMFNLADKALYAVKAHGRNKVFYGRTVNGNFLAKEPEPQPVH